MLGEDPNDPESKGRKHTFLMLETNIYMAQKNYEEGIPAFKEFIAVMQEIYTDPS